MELLEVEDSLEGFLSGVILRNEIMKKHTTWRTGGPADIMVLPSGVDDIRRCLNFARERSIPVTVMGNGSNLLVRDSGIRGIVLKIAKGFNRIDIKDSTLTAESGALLPMAAKAAAEAGLSGLEFAAGIPASVGGAICMNAGAHGKCISDVVREVTVLGPDGEVKTLNNREAGFEYRKSGIGKMGFIVLGAEFSLDKGDVNQILKANEVNLTKRRNSQPLEYPNAGSVFANPPGQWAGWLIEQVGGKGMRIGGAFVSEKHANFIVNKGDATAEDILTLINRLKQLVLEKFNIELTLEVRVVGE